MITIDEARCTGCQTCVADCISHNIEVREGKAHVLGDCFQCGHCVAICPEGAVSIPDYPLSDVTPYDEATFAVSTRNLVNAFKFRRSIRQFDERAVSMADLHVLMEAAAHTPTAKNTMACRFVFIQDSLAAFKSLIWGELEAALAAGDSTPIDKETLEHMVALRKASAEDFLFRTAPAVMLVQAPDALDAGLAASAIEMTAATLGLGVLYNGYLRRVIEASEAAAAYTDSSFGEKPLHACLLIGHPAVTYRRCAPRRNPSVVLR